MNYYNENDPKAAAWLRVLIDEKQIPAGDVDQRSITDVKPTDLAGYTQCHFFAGIGGWSYALRLADWPEDQPVWTGSCPCQPFSIAGQGKGTADKRHLWPVFAGLIRAAKPPIVFGEQVASAAGRQWLAGVFADLEAMGYQRAAADLCAASVGAPHIRQRLYWVALAQHRTIRGHLLKSGQSLGPDQSGTSSELARSGSAGWVDNPTDSGAGRPIPSQPCGDRSPDRLSGTPSAISGLAQPVSPGQCGRDQSGPGANWEQMAEQKDRPHPANQSGDRCENVGGLANAGSGGGETRLSEPEQRKKRHKKINDDNLPRGIGRLADNSLSGCQGRLWGGGE